MSTPLPPPPRRPRARFAAIWAITALAATIACAMVGILADRFSTRWDVTSNREHTLTQRSRAILGNLTGPADITIVANLRAMDRSARDQLVDLGDTLVTASDGRVTVTLADAADTATAQVISRLVARIADREPDVIASQRTAIQDAAAQVDGLAASLESLDAPMRRLAGALTDPNESAKWSGGASALEPLVNDLRTAARELPAFADSTLSGTSLPEPDAAALAIKPVVQRVHDGLNAVAEQASVIAEESTSAPARDAAGVVSEGARYIADTASTITDSLTRIRPSRAAEVARALQRAEAIVVIGPAGVVIRPIDVLFASATSGSGQISFSGEEALIGAITASATAHPPILVLVHAERDAILDASGRPSGGLSAVCGRTLEDVASRGWKLAEWSTVRTPVMPDRAALGATDEQPIVWFVLGAPGTATGPDIQRTESLANGITRLLIQGEALLMTILPSDLPSLGETDPIAASLAYVGLIPDTGRPVVTKSQTPSGPMFSVDQVIPRADAGSAVGDAIGAIPTMLRLAIPMALPTRASVRWTPVFTIPASPDTWAEANWRILGTKRAAVEPPTPDPARDGLTGPWVIGGAIERFIEITTGHTQRIVVVGGALWYADAFTHATVDVQGRTALRFPGNAHLLHASLAWLAGQDELIPTAPDARDIPRIGALTATQLTTIRWVLVAGVPAAALLGGVLVRALRTRSGRRIAIGPSR